MESALKRDKYKELSYFPQNPEKMQEFFLVCFTS